MSTKPNSVFTPKEITNATNLFLRSIPTPGTFDYENKDIRDSIRLAFSMNAIPQEYLAKENYSDTAEGLLSYINLLDLTDNLLSVFAYIPETNEKGQSFDFIKDKVGDGMMIPLRDSDGNIIWKQGETLDVQIENERENRMSCNPPLVRVGGVTIPAISSDERGNSFFAFDSVDEDNPQDYITDRIRKKNVGRLNPTYCFELKQQLRQYVSARGTTARAVKEFVYVKLRASQEAKTDEYGRVVVDFIPTLEERYMVEYKNKNHVLTLGAAAYTHYKNTVGRLSNGAKIHDSAEAVEMNMTIDTLSRSTDPKDKAALAEILKFARDAKFGKKVSPEIKPEGETVNAEVIEDGSKEEVVTTKNKK